MQIAIDHHNMVLIQKCFTPWKEITQDTVQEKQRLADEMYNCILVRRALASWRRYGHLQSIQLQKARRHYSYTTKVKYFKLWQDYTMMRKEKLATEHNQYRIVKTAFSAWRRYPQVVKEEERRQKRMEEMRKKVQSILPDFGVS
ncbi:coiled-coil domain-containing protein 191-like isoform X1 [Ptychodera flava]|uniref:coiled-coil domain-containing protein 191-like isoform X1 n=1 Tax=Ptychodera flava TaxID=63121 RepID=UPI00396A9FBD